ncbi:MAG: hypothetical protein Q8P67_28635 [archaeon]|nr:hypothetical protein [archaeon]
MASDEERFAIRSEYLGRWLSEIYDEVLRQEESATGVEGICIEAEATGKIEEEENPKERRETGRSPVERRGELHVVHVAGTKGKGTICQGVSAGLLAAGHGVGMFVSPHVHSPLERIRVNGERISRPDYDRLLAVAKRCLLPPGTGAGEPDWLLAFDRYTAVGMAHFLTTAAKTAAGLPLEWLLVEVGVGGRYDSTTALLHSPALSPAVAARLRPRAVALAHISMDHQQLLGVSLAAIAWQKVGVVRQGMSVFSVAQHPDAAAVFRAECCLHDSPLFFAPAPSLPSDSPPHHRNRRLIELLLSHLLQRPQPSSAFVSSGGEEGADSGASWVDIDSATMAQACRYERFRVGASEVVLDGAHNGYSLDALLDHAEQDAAVVLSRGAGQSAEGPSRRDGGEEKGDWEIVFGCGSGKCVGDMLRVLRERRRGGVTLVQSKDPGACPVERLLEEGGGGGGGVLTAGSVAEALEEALGRGARFVLVCGSFYVARDARVWLSRRVPDQFLPSDPVFEPLQFTPVQ